MSQDMNAAQTRLTDQIIDLPGVAAVGQGMCDGVPCFRVYVVKLTPELKAKIPSRFDGFPVVVHESGEIRALPEEDSAADSAGEVIPEEDG